MLHHQGLKPTTQPVVNDDYVLMFNGDLFMDLDLNGQSDTDYLVSLFEKSRDESALRAIMGTLRGPYSLVFYNRSLKKLYFARDPMGRNSLLIGSEKGKLFLSSVSCYDLADLSVEVPPIGLFCLDVEKDELSAFPWYDVESHSFYQEQIEILNTKLKRRLHVSDTDKILLQWLKPVQIVSSFNSLLVKKI